MKDIDGIEQAIQVLKPHWGEIEADFQRHNERFLALAAADHDQIGRILRIHLVVESFLNSFLEEHYGMEDVEDLRLSFVQKAKLLPLKGHGASFVRPGILQLNSVRNKFGHRLNHEINPHEISAVAEVLSVARKGTIFGAPVDALEAFGPVACAFLSVAPPHLQEAFMRAFSGIKSYEPFTG